MQYLIAEFDTAIFDNNTKELCELTIEAGVIMENKKTGADCALVYYMCSMAGCRDISYQLIKQKICLRTEGL